MTSKVLLPSLSVGQEEAQNFEGRYLNSLGFFEKKFLQIYVEFSTLSRNYLLCCFYSFMSIRV